MRKRFILLGALIAVWAPACIVPSIHPLHSPETLVFDPVLLGDWKVDETTTWSFRAQGGDAYRLDSREDGEHGIFAAHLVRLGDLLFLDLRPERDDDLSLHAMHLVPAHSFARVRIDGDRFQLAMMSMNWVKEEIDAGRVCVAHEIVDHAVLLTAPTEELQRFVVAAAADPAAFPDESHDENAAFTAERIRRVEP